MGRITNFIEKGEVFERLTAISDVYRDEKQRVIDVKCKCGIKKTVIARKLKVGKIKSCGCLQREEAGKTGKSCILPNGEAAFNNILSSYKGAADRRKLEWKLTKEQFRAIIKQDCYYCEEKPSKVRKSHNGADDYISNGVDRVDNSKGYTEENSVPCCTFCNRAKGTYTKDYFIKKCKEVANERKKIRKKSND